MYNTRGKFNLLRSKDLNVNILFAKKEKKKKKKRLNKPPLD